jgi:hypothetical protein
MITVIKKTNFKPAITLFFLTPIISELLFGSTPVSRSYTLIIESLLYGPAALLIREFARRRNLGWLSIIMLGFAFGILLECLLLQSVFNPLFLGFDLSLGRTFGVNWLWGETIITYHALWSITLPILITELIFPEMKNETWLKKSGLYLNIGLALLGCLSHFAIFYKMSGYVASPLHFIAAIILIITFVLLSTKTGISQKQDFKRPLYVYILMVVTAFIAGGLWLSQISLIALKGSGLSSWIIFLLALLAAALVIIIIQKGFKFNDTSFQRLSIASGAILASMLFGLIVLAGSGNKMDEYFQVGFIFITITLLFVLRKHILLKSTENYKNEI